MQDGTYEAEFKDGKLARYRPLVSSSKEEALRQAVIYANGVAHAVRKTPEEIVAAATAFEAFLYPPEPTAAE